MGNGVQLSSDRKSKEEEGGVKDLGKGKGGFIKQHMIRDDDPIRS
jgi:hypothetical protein